MEQEGKVLHGYAYDARNRLERAWNDKGEEAVYRYNGMGQRVEKRSSTEPEEYLLDLTKPYHNLLGIQREKETESFYWDFTTIATEKKGSSPRYYLQDELGSPLRVQYATGKGECYGYDEFGQDQAEEKRGVSQKGFESSYVKQGTTQPFGYTGYRYDDISGSYFAQAREYQPHTGRFMGKDQHWNVYNHIYGDESYGNIPSMEAIQQSNNLYIYCMGNPVRYVDFNGNKAGDEFSSVKAAVKDFAEEINGISIEENVEYASYIYSWEEKIKIFGFIPWTKTHYSYTEPHTTELEHSVHITIDPVEVPIPEGKTWETIVHTHGAWDDEAKGKNGVFSDKDMQMAYEMNKLLYLVTPTGEIKYFNPNEKRKNFTTKVVVQDWIVPHDKNAPGREFNHEKECINCYGCDSLQ